MSIRTMQWVTGIARTWRSSTGPEVKRGIRQRLLQTKGLPNPTTLHRGDCTVHLLGTMHIAEASAVAARNLIRAEHAKGHLGGVFLELDEGRFNRLKRSSRAEREEECVLEHALSVLRRGESTLGSIIEVIVKTAYRRMDRMGFASGVEFKAAIETAEELEVRVILGDQEMGRTLSRVAKGFEADMYIPRVIALMVSHVVFADGGAESEVERRVREAFEAIAEGDVEMGQMRLTKLIDENCVGEIMGRMREVAPEVTRALLDERDEVMTWNLIEAVGGLAEGKRELVAIVGLAHVEGIVRRWEERAEL